MYLPYTQPTDFHVRLQDLNYSSIWGTMCLMGEIYLLPCQRSSYFSVQTNNRFTVSKTNIWVTGWRVWGSVLLGTHYWKQEGKPHNEKSLAGLQFMSARVWGEAITSETFGRLRHNMRGCCADKRRGRLCGSPSILLVPRRRYMKLNTQLLTTVTAAQKSWEFDIFAFEFTQRWWPREAGEYRKVVGSNPRTSGTIRVGKVVTACLHTHHHHWVPLSQASKPWLLQWCPLLKEIHNITKLKFSIYFSSWIQTKTKEMLQIEIAIINGSGRKWKFRTLELLQLLLEVSLGAYLSCLGWMLWFFTCWMFYR